MLALQSDSLVFWNFWDRKAISSTISYDLIKSKLAICHTNLAFTIPICSPVENLYEQRL